MLDVETDCEIIAMIRATEEHAAEIRYRVAQKLDRMMVVNRMARRLNTWVVRAGEDRRR